MLNNNDTNIELPTEPNQPQNNVSPITNDNSCTQKCAELTPVWACLLIFFIIIIIYKVKYDINFFDMDK